MVGGWGFDGEEGCGAEGETAIVMEAGFVIDAAEAGGGLAVKERGEFGGEVVAEGWMGRG